MKTYSPTRWSEMRAKEEETGAAVKVCSCKRFSLPTIDKSFREKNKKELSTSLKLIIYWSRKFCLKTLKSITRLATTPLVVSCRWTYFIYSVSSISSRSITNFESSSWRLSWRQRSKQDFDENIDKKIAKKLWKVLKHWKRWSKKRKKKYCFLAHKTITISWFWKIRKIC